MRVISRNLFSTFLYCHVIEFRKTFRNPQNFLSRREIFFFRQMHPFTREITKDHVLREKIEDRPCRDYGLLPAREKMRCDLPSCVRLLQVQLQTQGDATTHKKHTCQAQSYKRGAAAPVGGTGRKCRNENYYYYILSSGTSRYASFRFFLWTQLV